MKRLFCIALLSLVLFNTVGYYGVLMILERQLTTKFLQKIDANADEMSGDLMLTLPMNLPYARNSASYERVDGTVVYGGQVYRLVKQKYYNNMLYVVCIRDDRSTQVREEMNEYSRTFTNQQPDHADDAVKIVVSVAKYYLSFHSSAQPDCRGWVRDHLFPSLKNLYQFTGITSVFRPPCP